MVEKVINKIQQEKMKELWDNKQDEEWGSISVNKKVSSNKIIN